MDNSETSEEGDFFAPDDNSAKSQNRNDNLYIEEEKAGDILMVGNRQSLGMDSNYYDTTS